MGAEVGSLPGLDACSHMGGSAFGATAHDAVHDAFMTLPPYTRTSEDEVHELGLGVRNCSHRALSDPLSEQSECIERACEGTSAEGTARCASRGPRSSKVCSDKQEIGIMTMNNTSMQGKVCLVTGSSSGIGKVTARELAKMGATVVMVCRNRAKGEAARAEIKEESSNDQVDLIVADLSELSQVRRVASEFKQKYTQLHVLVNNAGGMLSEHKVTSEGLEFNFTTNYLAPFLLTELLLDVL